MAVVVLDYWTPSDEVVLELVLEVLSASSDFRVEATAVLEEALEVLDLNI